jgi:hypothetical protein
MIYPDPMPAWDDAAISRKVRDWTIRTRPDPDALRRVCAFLELWELADELITELAKPGDDQHDEQAALNCDP